MSEATHVAELAFAAIGGVSSVRWVIHRIFWVHSHYKAVVQLKASRRGYNVAYSRATHPSRRAKRRKNPPVDPALYTIPDDGNSK